MTGRLSKTRAAVESVVLCVDSAIAIAQAHDMEVMAMAHTPAAVRSAGARAIAPAAVFADVARAKALDHPGAHVAS